MGEEAGFLTQWYHLVPTGSGQKSLPEWCVVLCVTERQQALAVVVVRVGVVVMVELISMESGRGGTYATVTRMSTSAAATTYEVSSMADRATVQYSTVRYLCGVVFVRHDTLTDIDTPQAHKVIRLWCLRCHPRQPRARVTFTNFYCNCA